MKRSYISPEFKYSNVDGTFNMLEQTSFFGSKMIDILDKISIDDNDIVYYQQGNGEQLNFSSEKLLPPYVFSTNNSKLANHRLIMDPSQNTYSKLNDCKWIIELDVKNILIEYIFASLKEVRVFSNVLSKNTKSGNINESINEYINYNIYDRYKVNNIQLYLNYIALDDDDVYQSLDIDNKSGSGINGDLGEPKWRSNIYNDKYIENKVNYTGNFDNTIFNLEFNQEKKRSMYNYEYYFIIDFVKR